MGKYDHVSIHGLNPDQFVDTKARAAYVERTYFSALQPGFPFMLVIQYIENQQTSCSITRGTYDDFVVTESYVGILSDGPQLFRHDPLSDAFVIGTARYVQFVTDSPWLKLKGEESGELRIHGLNFSRTPLEGEFEAKNYFFRSRPRAFTVAVGRNAIEEFCLSGRGRELELPRRYIVAARQLGIGLFCDEIRAIRTSIRDDLLADLLMHRSNAQRRDDLLKKIAEFGFDKDTQPVRIRGIRYRPNELVEDIRQQGLGA